MPDAPGVHCSAAGLDYNGRLCTACIGQAEKLQISD